MYRFLFFVLLLFPVVSFGADVPEEQQKNIEVAPAFKGVDFKGVYQPILDNYGGAIKAAFGFYLGWLFIVLPWWESKQIYWAERAKARKEVDKYLERFRLEEELEKSKQYISDLSEDFQLFDDEEMAETYDREYRENVALRQQEIQEQLIEEGEREVQRYEKYVADLDYDHSYLDFSYD